jgi:hypothetical protein
MQNFIVLGYVPGTTYQINFYGWLLITASVFLAYPSVHITIRYIRKHLSQASVSDLAVGPVVLE